MAESPESKKLTLEFDSLSVHAGLKRTENQVKDIPVYASTSFVFNDSAHGAAIFNMTAEAFCYSRIANPTVDVFEKRMAALEGGEAALATASGEAALFVSITALAHYGSNIAVASDLSEISVHQFKHRLPALGIEARFVESGNADEVRDSIDHNTKALFVESISTKNLLIADVEALASIAHENGIPLIVDNTNGAGGFFIRPIMHGADIVIQSAAPWLSISGSNTGGVIVDSGNFLWEKHQARFPQFSQPSPGFHGLKVSDKFGKLAFAAFARIAVMRDIGPCLNPFEAAMLVAGLETLAVRMERVGSNAKALAIWLEGHERVGDLKYPGLASHSSHCLGKKYLKRGYGGLVAFIVKTESEPSISRLKLVSQGSSVGGSRTLLIPGPVDSPLLLCSKESGNTCRSPSQVYVSVGLENIVDIKNDFDQAFA